MLAGSGRPRASRAPPISTFRRIPGSTGARLHDLEGRARRAVERRRSLAVGAPGPASAHPSPTRGIAGSACTDTAACRSSGNPSAADRASRAGCCTPSWRVRALLLGHDGNRRVPPHEFRHSCATLLRDGGRRLHARRLLARRGCRANVWAGHRRRGDRRVRRVRLRCWRRLIPAEALSGRCGG